MKLNTVQAEAVDTLDLNLSLKAGAGTGKTKVLTERFINILKNGNLTDGEEYGEVLSITFTNKAAEEMRNRILEALSKNRSDEKIDRLYRNFSAAQIYTIHGFCTMLIKKYPLVANVDPLFKVSEDREALTLLEESVEETILKYSEDARLYELMLEKKYLNSNSLRESLIAVYFKMRNKSTNVAEIRKKNSEYNDLLKETDFKELVDMLLNYSTINPGKKFMNYFESENMKNFLERPTFDLLDEIAGNLGTSKKVDLEREEIELEILKQKKSLERENYKCYELIIEMLDEIIKVYENKKREKSILDYDDLQLKALEVLKKGYGKEYKYIMVDEFQDTNSFQVEILKQLTNNFSKDKNIFIVGDEKQSIYSFRGGSVEEYNSFAKDLIASGGREIAMDINYRSSNILIDSFNKIFSKIMGEGYDPLKSSSEGGTKVKVLSYFNTTQKAVASYIKNLVDAGEKPEGIAILFRRKKNIAKYERELLNLGIKVNNTAQKFSERVEIRDVLSLLKCISNKRDYLSLMSYLKSPMVGLNENSIYLLSRNLLEKGEVEELEVLEAEQKTLLKSGMERLKSLRDFKEVLSLGEIVVKSIEINRLFETSNICFGEFSIDSLNELIDLAFEYEDDKSESLEEFIKYVENLEVDVPLREGAVNLITIHKSKGLEYNTVIMGEIDFDFSRANSYNFIQLGKCGLGVKLENRDAKYSEIMLENRLENIEEENRIFYVALTRAVKNLILPINRENKVKKNSYRALFENSGFEEYEEVEEQLADVDIDKKPVDKSYLKEALTLKSDSLIRENYIEKFKSLKFYSASSYMTFKKSPELFYRSYILGEDVEEKSEYSGEIQVQAEEVQILNPMIRGNIVHKYVELNPVDIDEFIREELLYYGVPLNEEIADLLKVQFKNYENLIKGKALFKEYEFYYPLRNGVINGFIDQVREVDGEVEIVDFKTAYDNKDELVAQYTPQLQIYTEAFEQISGGKVSRAKLIFLSDNSEYEVDISRDALKNNVKEFEDFINFVESHNELKDYINNGYQFKRGD
ncbi:ATP-dependent helicase/nuclease subunit A [Anaerosphaera aminiphila DSM 21120]|uniref:DNA 3'-5' helicase n=1 Tax=Anaerosphaera aminiphila DSM 21120 TaxID=1120995 RepID=A0A1M5R2Q1_9FIRM|nr:UvrD-helicase domain-containing protein [Anaerosphaera aminiphila]SHH20612.1 ATP-dependent helicase/nuclease subunit A [Anaerosphaera aminiphila DSM 21120]